MVSMEMEMSISFPTIIRVNPESANFQGIVDYGLGQATFVKFHVPNYPKAKDITFETRIKISESDKKTLETKSENINFLEFLKLLTKILADTPKTGIFDANSFMKFFSDYMSLKNNCLNEKFIFDKEKSTLKIISPDDNLFEHEILISLNFDDSRHKKYVVKEHSFPELKNKKLFTKENDLKVIHEQFLKFIGVFGKFYEVMNNIDTICWILDPGTPTPKQTSRRIVIEEGVSMQVTFDPYEVTKQPDIKFFGPARLVDKYISNLAENIEDWDPEYDIVQGIQRLIGLTYFPIKPEESEDNKEELYEKEECCICLSMHLNEKLPEIICDNDICEKRFHTECLYEWLSAIPTNQKLFNLIHGNCPICDHKISCQSLEAQK